MANELARTASHLPTVTDDGFLEEVRTQIAPKATDSELRFFANVVAKTQLDPWSRQVYLIPRWDGRVKREVHRPQVSIDGLRLIAERSGKYEGQTPVEWCGDDGAWRDTWFDQSAPRAARVGVYKAGRAVPTYAIAHYDEYVVTDKSGKASGQWKDKPRLMIAKCAEALALRKCFPQETSGLYTAEEMGRADVDSTAVDLPPEPVAVIEAPAVEEWTASPAAIVGFLNLAEAAGYGENEGTGPWGLLRMQVAIDGAANEGDIEGVVTGLSRAQFEACWVRLEAEKVEREGGS